VTVVLDANALVALIASEPNGPAVSELIERWTVEERELHAPVLARYEIANVLARQHAVGRLSKEDVKSGWQALEELPITYHALIDGPAVIDLAATLGRRSAFDASYVALARALDAELWTLDGPLARNAAGQKLPVRLIDRDDREAQGSVPPDAPAGEPPDQERSQPT
jgi:predicted nucleic acid-binding protein